MLGNGVCDPDCDTFECYFDDGDCYCPQPCHHDWLGDEECDEECNNEDCDYDWGDCEHDDDDDEDDDDDRDDRRRRRKHSHDDDDDEDISFSSAELAGLIIGCVVGTAVLAAIAFLIYRRNCRKHSPQPTPAGVMMAYPMPAGKGVDAPVTFIAQPVVEPGRPWTPVSYRQTEAQQLYPALPNVNVVNETGYAHAPYPGAAMPSAQ